MSTQPTAPLAAETPERLAFYERISQKHMTPLWVSLANLVTPEPVSACQPAAWSFADIRAAMIEAGESDHRQGSRAARADSREPRAPRAVEDHHRSRTPACSSSCPAKSHRPTVTRRARCVSCSKAAGRTRR